MSMLRYTSGIALSGLLTTLGACTTIWDEKFECDPQYTEIIENSHSQVYRHREEISDILNEEYIPKGEQVVSFNEVADSMIATPFLCGYLKPDAEEEGEIIRATYNFSDGSITFNNETWDNLNENILRSGTLDEILGLYILDEQGFLILDKDKVKDFLAVADNPEQKAIELFDDFNYIHTYIMILGEASVHENAHRVLEEKGEQYKHTDPENPEKDNIFPYGFAAKDYLLNNREYAVILDEALSEL